MKKIDGVFAGGGVRAFALIGALQEMEKKKFIFERVAGTSAGALFAALIKVGYTSDEILQMFSELDIESFKDERKSLVPLRVYKWMRVYYRLGLYKGDTLEEWIKDKLAAKGVQTFGDMPKGTLKIIASDLTNGRIIVLPDDLEQYGLIPDKFPVARAIRMSCSIPYFFEPVKLYDRKGNASIIVDGGVLSNFPLWLFLNDKPGKKILRPVIGYQLTPNLDEILPNKINNAFEMFHSLFETMRKAHDVRYIAKEHALNIVFIPIDNVKATDFNLKPAEITNLVSFGREKTRKFLEKWSY